MKSVRETGDVGQHVGDAEQDEAEEGVRGGDKKKQQVGAI